MVESADAATGPMTPRAARIEPDELATRLAALPGAAPLREALAGERAYLVGGAVRDLLLGIEPRDLDLAVEGDAIAAARLLGGERVEHPRFGTATVRAGGITVNLASTRTERYERPGALPVVEPAELAADLARRDFTVNAIAVALARPGETIDPHGGLEDLERGTLRVLHARSFEDDPTRALRAARYAARLGLSPEPHTERLLRESDLATLTRERVEEELRRLAGERDPVGALRLLVEWGVVRADLDLAAAALALTERDPWAGLADRASVVLGAAGIAAGPFSSGRERDAARALLEVAPERPSACARAAQGHDATTLAIARAMGAEWLDEYATRWRGVRLEISGEDLLAAGVERGPAVGRGLEVALAAKLDGEVHGREEELRLALAAARA